MGDGSVFRVDPATLVPHPDQVAIYGEGTPAEDDELVRSIERTDHIEVVTVTFNTPDLADGTIISGHRRARAARRLGRAVLVERVKYASRAHADQAHILLNKQRDKDQKTRTLEAAALARIEGELARQRMALGGGDRKSSAARSGSARRALPDETGRASEKVAEKLGEGATTVETRLKLFALALEQSPDNPSDAPVMKELETAKSVGEVARKHGVGRSGGKPKTAPKPRTEPTRPAVKTRAPQAAAAKPKADAAAARRRERAVRAESFLREMRGLLQRAGELLHDDPLLDADAATRAECVEVAEALVIRLRTHVLDVLTPTSVVATAAE